jgi:predicted DNA binding protein
LNELAFTSLSKHFPEMCISRWCNLKLDILQLESEKGTIDRDTVSFTENFLEEEDFEIIGTNLHSNVLEIVVVCRCSLENSSVSRIEDAHGIPVMPVRYREGREYLHVLAFNEGTVMDIIRSLQGAAEVRLLKKGESTKRMARPLLSIPAEELMGTLTYRQLETFVRAYELGYYSIPKKITIQGISERTGIPRSTIEEHLRKAEVKIFRAIRPYARMVFTEGERNSKHTSEEM